MPWLPAPTATNSIHGPAWLCETSVPYRHRPVGRSWRPKMTLYFFPFELTNGGTSHYGRESQHSLYRICIGNSGKECKPKRSAHGAEKVSNCRSLLFSELAGNWTRRSQLIEDDVAFCSLKDVVLRCKLDRKKPWYAWQNRHQNRHQNYPVDDSELCTRATEQSKCHHYENPWIVSKTEQVKTKFTMSNVRMRIEES